MQIQCTSIQNFKNNIHKRKYVFLTHQYPPCNKGILQNQEIPDLSLFLEKNNPHVLYKSISFYNQVKAKFFPSSQKRLQILNKLV